MSLRCGERWPVSDSGQGEHRCPRSREGTHPDHISCVRNTETPSRSDPPCRRAGKPTVRNPQFLGGNRMTKKRTPAAETQQETEIGWPAPFSWRSRITGRIPGLMPGRESALTWSGEPTRRRGRSTQPTDKLDVTADGGDERTCGRPAPHRADRRATRQPTRRAGLSRMR
jgi:hypothetical protein